MPMYRRTLVLLVAAIVITTTAATVGTAAGGSDRRSHEPNRVRIVGTETFEANALIQSTVRFSPEVFFPHTGERVRWIDQDESEDPHTVTLVERGDLPSSVLEAFNCGPCNDALDAHFAGDQPKLKVNVGEPGLDQPGDSLLLLPGESIAAPVSAAAGTTLYYLCAIHPWMQGRLVVG
jgi:plastocyanin